MNLTIQVLLNLNTLASDGTEIEIIDICHSHIFEQLHSTYYHQSRNDIHLRNDQARQIKCIKMLSF